MVERFKLPADAFDHLDYKGRRFTTILEIIQLLVESERTKFGRFLHRHWRSRLGLTNRP
jgi:hypothetical protein